MFKIIILLLSTFVLGNIEAQNTSEKDNFISSAPTEENAKDYYTLAESLYNENRIQEAKSMFLRIAYSKLKAYQYTYPYHPYYDKDTINYFKGYGSETYNFQHNASIYLAEIYIKEKDYENALQFVKKADKKHPLSIGCGTGTAYYLKNIQDLYLQCYEGLESIEELIKITFLYQYDFETTALAKILKKKYSNKQLNEIIGKAIESIQIDDVQPNGEFLIHQAHMKLLDTQIKLWRIISPKDETITKEHFIKELKETSFYKQLYTKKNNP